jgi:hypothetical protein
MKLRLAIRKEHRHSGHVVDRFSIQIVVAASAPLMAEAGATASGRGSAVLCSSAGTLSLAALVVVLRHRRGETKARLFADAASRNEACAIQVLLSMVIFEGVVTGHLRGPDVAKAIAMLPVHNCAKSRTPPAPPTAFRDPIPAGPMSAPPGFGGDPTVIFRPTAA